MAFGRGKKGRHAKHNKLDATPPWEDAPKEAGPETKGPWDADEAPADDVQRIDFGALKVPASGGVDIRMQLGPDGALAAVALTHNGSELQVGAFAAPRTSGIWDDVRKEILGSIASQGGTGQEVRGEFGKELTGRIPVQGGFQQTRFIGVDGPRWFLRGLVVGPAAAEESRAVPLIEAFRNIVVVRGGDPMPVRDALPLTLPKDLADQAAAEQAKQQGGGPA